MFVDESDKEFRLPGNQELEANDRNRRRMTFAARPKNAASYEEEQTTKIGSLRDIASQIRDKMDKLKSVRDVFGRSITQKNDGHRESPDDGAEYVDKDDEVIVEETESGQKDGGLIQGDNGQQKYRTEEQKAVQRKLFEDKEKESSGLEKYSESQMHYDSNMLDELNDESIKLKSGVGRKAIKD